MVSTINKFNSPLVSTTVYMEIIQHECLKKFSVKTGIPMGVYVRRGIDMVIAEVEQQQEREERWKSGLVEEME